MIEKEQILELFYWFHRHPELSYEEFGTTEKIREILKMCIRDRLFADRLAPFQTSSSGNNKRGGCCSGRAGGAVCAGDSTLPSERDRWGLFKGTVGGSLAGNRPDRKLSLIHI